MNKAEMDKINNTLYRLHRLHMKKFNNPRTAFFLR